MNILGLISQLIGIKTLRLTETNQQSQLDTERTKVHLHGPHGA